MSEPVDPMHAAMLAQMQNLEAFKQATTVAESLRVPEIPAPASALSGLLQKKDHAINAAVATMMHQTNDHLGGRQPAKAGPPPPLTRAAAMPQTAYGFESGADASASSSALPMAPALPAGSPEYERSEREKFINFVQQHKGAKEKREEMMERARKEAEEQAELQKLRCHLHKKPNQKCKFCKRLQEHLDRRSEANAAERAQREQEEADAKKNVKNPLDELELANPRTFGFPDLFRMHIVDSVQFKALATLETFEQVVKEINEYGDSIEPYQTNSTTVPTILFACIYRLFTMGLNQKALMRLIDDENNPYLRCGGFLFIRFGLPPEQLWSWLEAYILDEEEVRPSKDSEFVTSIGEFVEGLLSQERYYSIVLPRLPVPVKRQLEAKLAQVPQFRKRAQANAQLLDVYRQPNVNIQICDSDGNWMDGVTVYLEESSAKGFQLHVRIQDGTEHSVNLGKIILADHRYGASQGYWRPRKPRSRSRSNGQTDWSREKGKTGAQLVEEVRRLDRDRAVCSSGKDYAKKPLGVKAACALPREMGMASQKLMGDETFVPLRQRGKREYSPELSSRPSSEYHQEKRSRPSAEYQAQMQQLFEKYGMSKPSEPTAAPSKLLEGPDVMRLG